MRIWIDLEDASGQKYGDGPITTAIEWRSTRRLDRAGTFTFRMPAADPRAQYLDHKRIVRCWTADGGLRELDAGIIERIAIEPQSDGTTILEVSGDDLFRELAQRTVGDLALYQDTQYDPDSIRIEYADGSPGYTVTLPSPVNLSNDPLSFLYIQHTEPFSRISMWITSGNARAAELSIQYYNGTSAAWESLGNVVNGTVVGGAPFAMSGDISFAPPSGWAVEPVSGRWIIRFSAPDVDLSTFTLSLCTVHIVRPVADGLARIMSKTPAGWSLDPAGQLATESDVYLSYAGESVLTALIRLAEQTGEHFVRAPSGRRVRWLGTAQEASGLRAIATNQPGGDTMALVDLTKVSDSYDLYTRAYAYGGGVGAGRLTLASTTRSMPGYTLSRTESYLQSDAAVAAYGQVDKNDPHGDIVPSELTETQQINAANALFDRVYQALARKCKPQQAYTLSVVPGDYPLYPGQTIRVTYHRWYDGYHAVNVDTDLWVLEVTQTISADGVLIVDPVVATVDYWPDDDSKAVAKTMGQMATTRAVSIPEEGLGDSGAGVPVAMSVVNGKITALTKRTPIPDGTYSSVDIIQVRDGVIVGIWSSAE